MNPWAPGSRIRRLLAQLSTTLIVGLIWGLLLADRASLGEMWAAVALCLLAWLLSGVAGALLRAPRPMRPWAYPLVGGGIPALVLLVHGAGWRSGGWAPFAVVPILAAAATWYWFCAYWRPRGSGGAPGSA